MWIRAPESTSPPHEPSSYDVDLESGVLFEFKDAMRTHGCVRVIADCTKQTTFAWTAYDNKASYCYLFQSIQNVNRLAILLWIWSPFQSRLEALVELRHFYCASLARNSIWEQLAYMSLFCKKSWLFGITCPPHYARGSIRVGTYLLQTSTSFHWELKLVGENNSLCFSP
jgi:hypothetical protein